MENGLQKKEEKENDKIFSEIISCQKCVCRIYFSSETKEKRLCRSRAPKQHEKSKKTKTGIKNAIKEREKTTVQTTKKRKMTRLTY